MYILVLLHQLAHVCRLDSSVTVALTDVLVPLQGYTPTNPQQARPIFMLVNGQAREWGHIEFVVIYMNIFKELRRTAVHRVYLIFEQLKLFFLKTTFTCLVKVVVHYTHNILKRPLKN